MAIIGDMDDTSELGLRLNVEVLIPMIAQIWPKWPDPRGVAGHP